MYRLFGNFIIDWWYFSVNMPTATIQEISPKPQLTHPFPTFDIFHICPSVLLVKLWDFAEESNSLSLITQKNISPFILRSSSSKFGHSNHSSSTESAPIFLIIFLFESCYEYLSFDGSHVSVGFNTAKLQPKTRSRPSKTRLRNHFEANKTKFWFFLG